jgi:hypothetical protein
LVCSIAAAPERQRIATATEGDRRDIDQRLKRMRATELRDCRPRGLVMRS